MVLEGRVGSIGTGKIRRIFWRTLHVRLGETFDNLPRFPKRTYRKQHCYGNWPGRSWDEVSTCWVASAKTYKPFFAREDEGFHSRPLSEYLYGELLFLA